MKCEECKNEIKSNKVEEYSKKHFEGKAYCYDCQQRKKGNPPLRTVGQETVTSTDRNGSIVRQCCLKAACELAEGFSSEDIDKRIMEVITIAEKFEAWVNR